MIILKRREIESLIDLPNMANAVEEAYKSASAGKVKLPPVGHIAFPDLLADCHIKYGHIIGQDNFVIKVATGFPTMLKTVNRQETVWYSSLRPTL